MRNCKSGMALVFVLWVVVLLTAIAFQMTYRGHLRARVTATTGETAQAHFLARSGIEMAISDLVVHAKSAADQATLRDDSERLYKNIEIGRGTYTLFAGMDRSDPTFGFIDECAKLNINTADVEMLARLSTLRTGVAEAIIALREEVEYFHDLSALQLIDGIDLLDIYGEDQNGNGLLDSNENDGDQSWPPDDSDGELDEGMARYLTVWSAARDVDADGEPRLKLGEASAEEIIAALPEVTQQQADSIVYHREQNQFSSLADLLDVELIEKVSREGDDNTNGNTPQDGSPNPGQSPSGPQNGENQDQQNAINTDGQQGDGQDGNSDVQQGQGSQQGADGQPQQSNENNPGEGGENPQNANQENVKKTGQKAFDQDTYRNFADLVTIEEDEVLRGRINVNTAPLEVLACLPEIDESIAQAIVNDRQGRLNGFETPFDLLSVRGMDDNRLKGILRHISVRSDVFTVRSFGVLRNERTFASTAAVLDRTESTVRVLQWRDHG